MTKKQCRHAKRKKQVYAMREKGYVEIGGRWVRTESKLYKQLVGGRNASKARR